MGRTTAVVVGLALLASVAIGALVGRMAGGSTEPPLAVTATIAASPSPTVATAPPAFATPVPPSAASPPAGA